MALPLLGPVCFSEQHRRTPGTPKASGSLGMPSSALTVMLRGLQRVHRETIPLQATHCGQEDKIPGSEPFSLWLQDPGLPWWPCLYPWASGIPPTTWLFCLFCISTICAASSFSAVRCARVAAGDCQLQPHGGLGGQVSCFKRFRQLEGQVKATLYLSPRQCGPHSGPG